MDLTNRTRRSPPRWDRRNSLGNDGNISRRSAVGKNFRQDRDSYESHGRDSLACNCCTGQISHARGKERRSVKRRPERGTLTRSTSCSDVCYLKYQDANSGTDTACEACHGSLPNLSSESNLGLEVMLSLINGPLQSVIDSKDEKILQLQRSVDELQGENRRMREDGPAEAVKILALERSLGNCTRQIEQLEEGKKTASETIRFLEDLRKNDSKYVDILKGQINDLEMKLSKGDERVRAAEKEWKVQNECLGEDYKKRIEELEASLRTAENKLRDFEHMKTQVAAQKEELEERCSTDGKVREKLYQQVLGLQREVKIREAKIGLLQKDKTSLEESLSQSENLQRQDQRSSYVLQMKIVELQEKLEASCRRNDELMAHRRHRSSQQASVKSNRLRTKSVSDLDNTRLLLESRAWQADNSKRNNSHDLNNNNILHQNVSDLGKHFYSKATTPSFKNDNLIQTDLNNSKDWLLNAEPQATGNLHKLRTLATSTKKELALTGDKRRQSSDDCSSTSSSCSSTAPSSTSSSRRTSFESPKAERRQLKILKVRKVSKENISQFQQNATPRKQVQLKDVCEDNNGSQEIMKSNHKHSKSTPRNTIKNHTC